MGKGGSDVVGISTTSADLLSDPIDMRRLKHILGEPQVNFTKADWVDLFNDVTDFVLPRSSHRGKRLPLLRVSEGTELPEATTERIYVSITKILDHREFKRGGGYLDLAYL
jgi:hypothetical protein